MKSRFFLKLMSVVLLAAAQLALAAFDPVNDDTDIFLANPNITAERPNVLIILDNTANWNLPFTNEKNALVQVVNGLSDQFNVGLMMFPETGSPNDSVDGGYVRYHVRQMTSTNKTALSSMVNNLDRLGDVGNNATTGLAMFEAYLYFAGKASLASFGKVKTDFTGNTANNRLAAPLTGHALPASPTAASLYTSPVVDGCQRNFIIYISNGPANENAAARSKLQGLLAALVGKNPPDTIAITPSGQQGDWADETAKFMANADVTTALDGVQNVFTYVVEVDAGTVGQGPDMTALLKSMASNGKGKYFGVTSSASGSAIVDALNAIFTEVQAVNSVFASTTLPVSVNVRGTNINQVYIGVFRPDANKAPRWLGNLKLYNLALNSATSQVFLADAINGPPPAVGNAVENSVTGFVTGSAVSFWTTNSNFWAFRDPSQNGVGGASDAADGDLVEKGGSAQQLRIAYAAAEASSPARNLYTCTTGGFAQCIAGSALSATPFNTSNTDIDAVSLALDTRLVSPLTAYATQSATSVTDHLPISFLINTIAGNFSQVSNLNNGSITRTITNLTTAVPKVVCSTCLTGLVANTLSVGISSIAKISGNFVVSASGALPSNFQNNATVTIAGNSGSGVNGNFTISNINTSAKTFQINASGGSSGGTGGTASVTNAVNSTTATATLPGHGYVSGQSVTINGAAPSDFNQTRNITVVDADHFTYSIPTAQGNATVAGGFASITASGNTTIATATTSAAHPFVAGSTVTITGASNPAYNGPKTIISVPSTTSFTYSVGGTAVGPNTNTTGVSAFQGGSTTVTVTTFSPHNFSQGQTVFITGSDVSGYNGAFAINCGGCVSGDGSTTFRITTATVQPANTSTQVYVSDQVSNFMLGIAPNHGLKDGDKVMIEGGTGAGDPIAGPYEIWTVFGSDSVFEIKAPGLPAITSTNYTIRPVGGTNGVTGLPGTGPLAYATVPNHGYPNGQEVRIAGANPAGYNGTQTITVCDGTQTTPSRFGGTSTKFCSNQQNMFTYPLASAPGPNTSLAVTSSIKSTLARATAVAHGFATGDSVTISGASPNAFNGTVTITVVDADTFTYTIGSAEGDATGTIAAIGSGGIDRTALINWVRGQDNFQDENTNLNLTDIRASAHGDVLHSRPAVVNYNRFGSDNDVYVFYGANDGIVHAIKGGYATDGADPAGLAPGREAWGFIPKEFFGSFTRMRNNSPTISSSFKKPYFADGPIGIYTTDANSNGKLGDTGDVVNLYIAMRRGGRLIYALDVNDPNNPRYLWKIDNTTTGFSELGQTWSEPKVVTNINGYSNPVLIFGAGYDPAVEDIEPSAITSASATSVTTAAGTVSRTMGRGIYVVDAITGALVWSAGRAGSGTTVSVAGMDFAIPSDLAIIKNASVGGPVTHAYVGDTGGNLWRIDFAGTNLASSTVTQLAAVGDLTTAAGRRKFQFPPDVVAQVGFDAVLIGSGDREHPFDTTVVNRMYMFKDISPTDAGPKTGNVTTTPPLVPAGTEPTIVESALFDATTDCIQDPAGCSAGQTQASSLAALNSANGWFITLGAGEKVVGNAVSIAGTTFFNTNQPSSTAGGGACGSNLGIARQYEVNTVDATATNTLNTIGGVLTAASRSTIHAGGGYLPSPVHVVVMLGGKPVEAVISGTEVRTPAGVPLSARLRKYWYKEIE